jgi:Domain of unknown function (DUF4337)
MAEEIEVPMEHLHERINEEAHEGGNKWTMAVALSTACMAVLAAIAALLAGHHANEALLEQIKSSNQWAYYQSKSIKSEIASSTNSIISIVMPNADKQAIEDNTKKIERYETEKEAIKKTAETSEKSAEIHLTQHVTLSKAVTIFQIAIALSAISILTKRRLLWFVSLGLTAVGLVFLIMGFF